MSVIDGLLPQNMRMSAGFVAAAPRVQQALRQHQNQMFEKAASLNIPGVTEFLSRSKAAFEDYNFGDTARKLDAMRNQLTSMFDEDRIVPVVELSDMQVIANSSLEYVMSVPIVQELYAAGEIHGYGDRYSDPQPMYTGMDNFYQRTAHSTMFQTEELEEGGTITKATTYSESMTPPTALNFHSRCALKQTMESVVRMIEEGVNDPTDEWNNPM